MHGECRDTLRTIDKGMRTPRNQHDVLVIAEDDIFPYWLELKVKRGQLSRAEADAAFRYWRENIWPEDPEQQKRIKSVIEAALGNIASIRSSMDAALLIKDFGITGRFYETVSYAGRRYIIFKGYAGLRELFHGTRYLSSNPQIVSMGVGRLGVKRAVIAGAKLTIVLMAAYRVVEYLLDDKATLTRLVGSLATDVIKIGVASALGYVAGTGAVAFGLVAGPLVASVIVGAAVALGLEFLDGRHGATEKLVAQLEILLREIGAIDTWACRVRVAAVDAFYDAADAAAEAILAEVRRRGERAVRKLIGPTFYRGPAYLPVLRW